jgi:spore coat protein A
MSKITRRQFIKGTAAAGAGLALPLNFRVRSAYAAAGPANSPNLEKWIQPLRNLTALGDPNGIPVLSGVPDPTFANTTYYQVTAGEYLDQLHPDLPNPTTLWGYWDTTNPVKRHLGGVILAEQGTHTRTRITNTLPPTHIIPVDTTLPGANAAQNRIAVHLHGGFVPWISDGGPFDWFAPDGTAGLSFLNGPGSVFDNIDTQPMVPGQADYYYPDDETFRLMWYHDHAHGTTRINAYAGLATAYLLQDQINADYVSAGTIPDLDSTFPLIIQDKIFVSDTTEQTDPTWAYVARPDVQVPGSLWYKHVPSPLDLRLLRSPEFRCPPNPSVVPEFFGDTMLANGLVYPELTVEAKRYRFLMLNACNARFLNINLFEANPDNPDGIDLNRLTQFPRNPPGPDMIQLGTEGGFLVQEVYHESPQRFNPRTFKGNLILGPAERADFIVDFTDLDGQEFIMYNDAPAPFPSGDTGNDYYLGNPRNQIQPQPGTGPDTRQILRIKVAPATTPDPQPDGPILNPNLLSPAPIVPYTTTVAPIPPLPIPAGVSERNLTLNEQWDEYGRLWQMIGTTAPTGRYWPQGQFGPTMGFGREYLDPATEVIAQGTTEVWRIYNLTSDAHPMHFHLVDFQILSRQPFRRIGGLFLPSGLPRGPEPDELGWKETIKMYPGEMTTIITTFNLPVVPFNVASSPRATSSNNGMGLPNTPGAVYNEYVWHCHILEHEEHDMMRPLVVVS